MSNVTVRKLSGETLELTMLTLFRQLAVEESYQDVLTCLIKDGRAQVDLKDGSAIITYATTSLTVSQPRLPLGEYTADTKLVFELPAHVHCRADSGSEAKHLIEDVIHGGRGVPPGFDIEIDPTELRAFANGLEIKDMSVIRDVEVRAVDQRLYLPGRSSP